MTTTDPAVVWTVIVASALGTGVLLLLLKVLIDAASDWTAKAPADPDTFPAATPPKPAPVAPIYPPQPAVCDETVQLTAVQPARARHRKGTPQCN